MGERAQALTLEGSVAAMLLVMSLVFALQVSAVTPLTESTSSQHIENQQQEVGENVIRIAAEDGTLKSTVLFWNESAARYPGTDDDERSYLNGLPENASRYDGISADEHGDVLEFGQLLNRSFSDRGIAYSIHLNYLDENGDPASVPKTLVDQGQPSNHAVSVTRTLTLYEDDTLYPDGPELDDSDTFYMDNVDPDSPVYNVVEVELVIWRM